MGKKNRNVGTTDANNQDDLNVDGVGAEPGAADDQSLLDEGVDESAALEAGGVDTTGNDDEAADLDPVAERTDGGFGGVVVDGPLGDEGDATVDFSGLSAVPQPMEPASAADLHQEAIDGSEEPLPDFDGEDEEDRALEESPDVDDAPEVQEPGSEEAPVDEGPTDETPAEPEVVEPEPEEPLVEEEVDPTDAALRAELMGVLPAVALKAWPTKHLILFKKTGAYPEKTRRGNYLEDIRRTNALRDWQGSELEDWLDGKISTPSGVDTDKIVEEIYRRWRLPNNWTLDAARAFIFNGEKPGYTEAGVLIEDRAREASSLSQWTYQELRAAILGEITCQHKREDLVSQLRIRLGLSESFTETKLLEDLDKVNQGVTMDDILLKAKLEEYKAAMTKYPARDITEEHAGGAQTMLYKTIRQVLAREPAEFTEGWLTLLNFINTEYNELFYPERARLGWSALKMQRAAMTTFEELLSLMIFTREPANRLSGAKMFNIETIMRYVPDDLEKQNLHGFYSQPF